MSPRQRSPLHASRAERRPAGPKPLRTCTCSSGSRDSRGEAGCCHGHPMLEFRGCMYCIVTQRVRGSRMNNMCRLGSCSSSCSSRESKYLVQGGCIRKEGNIKGHALRKILENMLQLTLMVRTSQANMAGHMRRHRVRWLGHAARKPNDVNGQAAAFCALHPGPP